VQAVRAAAVRCRWVPEQALEVPHRAARHRQVRQRLLQNLLRRRVEGGGWCCRGPGHGALSFRCAGVYLWIPLDWRGKKKQFLYPQ